MVKKSRYVQTRHVLVLEYIKNYQSQYGRPPSIKEIGAHTNISSPSVVNYYLDQLESWGYLKRDKGIWEIGKKKPQKISTKHLLILEYIIDYKTQNKIAPSLREISHHTGISSTSVVNYYLSQLEAMGYIKRDKGISRGIRLTNKDPYAVNELGGEIARLINAFLGKGRLAGDSSTDAPAPQPKPQPMPDPQPKRSR